MAGIPGYAWYLALLGPKSLKISQDRLAPKGKRVSAMYVGASSLANVHLSPVATWFDSWGDPVAILCPKHYISGRHLCWLLKMTPCISVFLKLPCFEATFGWTTHFRMYIPALVTILASTSVSYKLITNLHFYSMGTESFSDWKLWS